MEEPLVKTKSTLREWMIWIALFILPLLFYPKALCSSWVSNSDVHSLLEFWAAAIALIAAGVVLVHFFATGRRFFLLISLGFTLQGAEDLVYAIYSFSRIWPAEQEGIANFVPGTYVAGRLILISCIFLALYLGKSVASVRNRVKEAIIYNSVGFLLASVTTAIVINSPLPRFILPSQIISRPVDFIAAVIYLFTFFFFVKFYHQKEHHTPFMWSMIGSIIFGFVTQVYMVHSQRLYDAQFDISHVMKIFSYVFPLFGVAVGTFAMYKKEESISEELSISIEKVKKAAKVLAVEIADRKKTEQALASTQQWQNTFDAISDSVFLLDTESKILQCNNAMAELLGKHYSQIIGRYCYEVVHGTSERIEECPIACMEDAKQRKSRVLQLNGRWFDAIVDPLLDDSGNLKGIVHILADITERKKAEESLNNLNEALESTVQKLSQSNQQLQEFVYVASHDLREPVRKIFSFGQLLVESLKGKLNDDQQENLNFMIDGANRMQQMIESLLVYSRVTTKVAKFEQVDLNEIIEQLKSLELANKLQETEGIILVPEPLPVVKADPAQMRQLLQNLISNGLKFHKKGVLPEVIMRAVSQDNGMVRIEVHDNGIGIKREQYDNAFVMFRRLHSGREYDGTGIGLAVCKKIIERHKGEIGVESTYGQSSTFWFTLPASESLRERTKQTNSEFTNLI